VDTAGEEDERYQVLLNQERLSSSYNDVILTSVSWTSLKIINIVWHVCDFFYIRGKVLPRKSYEVQPRSPRGE